MSNPTSQDLAKQVMQDVGGAFAVGLAYIGDKLGLFKAVAEQGPCRSDAIATTTDLHERYVLEWLKGMVAAEYIEYDPQADTFFMLPAQQEVFANEASPTFVGGAFQFVIPSLLHTPRVIETFSQGGGIPFAELGEEISDAISRMHRPWFDHLLTTEWLPGVPGLTAKLQAGISVLDVGCGLGHSSMAMASAYPNTRIVAIDPHAPSITKAKAIAQEQQLNNVEFWETALETLAPEPHFDLIVAIDCIHDMPDPVAALQVIKHHLKPEGLCLWSEPTGSHNPLENRNPLGKMRANLSPFHCLSVSLACNGAGLGTIIGEQGARTLASAAGFTTFERFEIPSQVQFFFGLQH